jgi:hypothetical protein
VQASNEADVSEPRMGSEFIQDHVDADTVHYLKQAMRISARAFLGAVLVGSSVIALKFKGYLWAPANGWPVFLAMFVMIACGMWLGLVVSAWLQVRAAVIYVSRQMPTDDSKIPQEEEMMTSVLSEHVLDPISDARNSTLKSNN